MACQSGVGELKAFLDAIEPQLDWQFDVETFEDRFRLQKYVLLAEDFGFEHEYRYGMHLRGPYSPSLAEDYYSDITDKPPDSSALVNFDAEAFADLVHKKDIRWLEFAATFREFFRQTRPCQPKHDRIQTAINRTVNEKQADHDEVQIIVDQLERAGVI